VEDLLAEAEAVDRAEDETFGQDRRGDEIPDELTRRQTRLQKMRGAKEAIEKDAREKATNRAEAKAQKEDRSDDEVREAASQAGEKAKPDKRAQRNFSDDESRMIRPTMASTTPTTLRRSSTRRPR